MDNGSDPWADLTVSPGKACFSGAADGRFSGGPTQVPFTPLQWPLSDASRWNRSRTESLSQLRLTCSRPWSVGTVGESGHLTTINKAFKKVLKDAGISENTRPYDLRKAFATRLWLQARTCGR